MKNQKPLLSIFSYKSSAKYLALFVTTLSVIHLPVAASIYQLKDEIAAYKQGNFRNVVFIGRVLVSECSGAENDIARYYLANAYSHLNRTQEAIEQYEICWINGKNPQIKTYARQALKALQKNPGKIVQSGLAKSNVVGQIDESSIRKEVMLQEENQIDQITEEAQRQIDDINETCKSDIAEVATHSNDADIAGVNTTAQPMIEDLRNTADTKIATINDDLARHIEEIKQEGTRRLSSLDESVASASTEPKPVATDDVQPDPPGSGLYVKNYLDYEGNLPAPPAVSSINGSKKILTHKLPVTNNTVNNTK